MALFGPAPSTYGATPTAHHGQELLPSFCQRLGDMRVYVELAKLGVPNNLSSMVPFQVTYLL